MADGRALLAPAARLPSWEEFSCTYNAFWVTKSNRDVVVHALDDAIGL